MTTLDENHVAFLERYGIVVVVALRPSLPPVTRPRDWTLVWN